MHYYLNTHYENRANNTFRFLNYKTPIHFRYAGEDGDPGLLEEMHEQLRLTIQKTFGVSSELAGRLLLELLQCVRRKNLVRKKLVF